MKVQPRHVAIIMDGNGRWAQAQGLPRVEGHRTGAQSVREVVRACRELGIEVLTLYSFSTENWKRPEAEVKELMRLLRRYLLTERQELLDQGIRLRIIGQLERLPRPVRLVAREVIRASNQPDAKMTLNLAISYGGRDEILGAVRAVAQLAKDGEMAPADVDEALFSDHMQTAGQPDPDLLIRTSGEMRLSNFLLWQVAYSEIYVTNTFWPDFRRPQLEEALRAYQRRDRRFGAIKRGSDLQASG